MTTSIDLFSRERLAGYDPAILGNATVALVGCGAAGNNLALNLALCGVRELRCIDFDVVEPSNLTRSPLFRRDRLESGRVRSKAHELALGAHALSYATGPVSRYANMRVERVGLGGLADCNVVISAVDSFGARALLADYTRLLGIPLVEVGFGGRRGHVSMFTNTRADEPCWRCLHPFATTGGFSCTRYAAEVAETGRIPATQPLAAFFSAYASDLVIQALHGRLPHAARMISFDLERAAAGVLDLVLDPECPGVHRRLGAIETVTVQSTATARTLLESVATSLPEPLLALPAPFVVAAPCGACGARVPLRVPAHAVESPPRCRTCSPRRVIDGVGVEIEHAIDLSHPLATERLHVLGMGPRAIVEIMSRTTGESRAIRLAGAVDDLFTTVATKRANARTGTDM